MTKEIITIHLSIPEYVAEPRPDYVKIGAEIDEAIKGRFLGQKIVSRALKSSEREESLDELIQLVQIHGTDRTDPQIKGKGYEGVDADIFGVERYVNEDSNITSCHIHAAYVEAIRRGLQPYRVDLIMLYGAELMECVPRTKKNGKVSRTAFKFKNPEDKKSALKGLVVIR